MIAKVRPSHSLRFTLALALLVPLVIGLAHIAYVNYRGRRQLMLDNLHLVATQTGSIIEGSVRHAMQVNDFAALQQIIADIGQHPEVLSLLLLDKEGRVVLADDPARIGETLTAEDPSCQACHQHAVAPSTENVLLTRPEGQYYRNVTSLENGETCQTCHDPASPVLGVLISDLSMDSVQEQLATYGRSSLLWAIVSIVMTLTAVGVFVDRGIIARVRRLTEAIGSIEQGDLSRRVRVVAPDELGAMAGAFNRMADGLYEKRVLEENLAQQTVTLRAQADELSALNALATSIGQVLDLSQILDGALDKVMALTRSAAGWILLWDEEREELRLAARRAPDSQALPCDGHDAEDCTACRAVYDLGKPLVSQPLSTHPCRVAHDLAVGDLRFVTCIRLESKNRVLGVMGLASSEARAARASGADVATMLTAVGRQIGIAIENASLYEELRRKEVLQRHLLERIIGAQEEERKRIARELHDQTGQALSSLIMTLEVLGQARSPAESSEHLEELRNLSVKILDQVHSLALEIRPSVLDDLGLLAATRFYLRDFQDRYHLPVEFQVLDLEDRRLRPEVETALYRIMQEALTNVVRHAQARSANVLLKGRDGTVVLIVEDDGVGFDVSQVLGSRLHEGNLGLYGMQERAWLVGGTLTVESTPGRGTAVYAEIPLESGDRHG